MIQHIQDNKEIALASFTKYIDTYIDMFYVPACMRPKLAMAAH